VCNHASVLLERFLKAPQGHRKWVWRSIGYILFLHPLCWQSASSVSNVWDAFTGWRNFPLGSTSLVRDVVI